MSLRQFRELFTVIKVRWFAITVATLLGAVAGAALGVALPVTYESTAQLFIATPEWNDNTSEATPDGRGRIQTYAFGDQFSQRRVVSYQQMVDSEVIAAAVIAQLNLQTTPHELAARISARVVPDTVLLEVQARDTTADGASAIANATAQQLINMIAKLETPSKLLESPIKPLVLKPAEPPSAPVSPNVPANFIGGVTLGLLLGLTYAAVRERIESDEVPDALFVDADTLGVLGSQSVPQFDGLDDLGTELAEDVRFLCLRLRVLLEGGLDHARGPTLLFTSPRASNGVGSTAVLVAAGFLELGRRVALVHTNFAPAESDSSTSPGLGEVLDGNATLTRVLRYDEAGRIGVVSAGRTGRAPALALGSQAMSDVLDSLSEDFDLVIVIGRATLESSESLELAREMTGVVLICPVPPTTGLDVVESERLLRMFQPSPLLGRVVVVDSFTRAGAADVSRSGSNSSRKLIARS